MRARARRWGGRACGAARPSGLALLHARVRLGLRSSGGLSSRESPLRDGIVTGAQLLDRRPRLVGGQRTVVALVDRGHRRDVAGPKALEAAQIHGPVLGA